MRASRLLSTLLLIQTRGRMSAQSLADELEVSIRTVYRDIDELSAAGIPVYGDRGPGGGFALLDGYRTGLTGMTGDEAQTLLLAGFPQAIEAAGMRDASATARLKLLTALPGRAESSRIAERMHLDPLEWYRRPASPPFLRCVAAATLEGRRLRIRYDSWKRPVSRTIDPLGLVLKAGAWYLVGAIDGRPRTYRAASILAAEMLEDLAVRPSGFVLSAYWAEACETFERSLRRMTATISVSAAGVAQLGMLGADIDEAVRAVEPDARGWRTADVPIESIDHAARHFLWMGSELIVLKPAALRSAIREQALDVAGLYDGVI